MKLANFIKSVSPIELSLFVLFIIYLVVPIETPGFLAPSIDSPMGMVVVFCVTLYLFLYTNPILGILYIFVAYELFRRSSKQTGKTAYIQYTPSQEKRDAKMVAMNPPKTVSLEEEVVSQMAPIGRSDPISYVNSSYKPVSDNVHNAFSI